MLQFLKKSGQRSQENLSNSSNCRSRLRSDDVETLRDAEQICLGSKNEEILEPKSRLSKNLLEILSDQTCLCFFVQFMEQRRSLSLIKFWLEVESFKMSAKISDKTPTESISEDKLAEDCLSNVSEEDDKDKVCDTGAVKAGNDAEKMAANCDIDRPLTDDEKSEIILDQQAKRISECQTAKPIHQKIETRAKKRLSQFRTTVATDAIKLFEKYLMSNSSYSLDDIPATIHANISLSLCNCDEDASVSPFLFEEAQHFVFDRLEKEFLTPFLDSEFYCKYCVDILTGQNLILTDILYSESIMFYFMEFMEQEKKREYLDFWMTATNFRRQLEAENVDNKEAQNDAMVLYDKYFSLQASQGLGFSDQVRSIVEENICTLNGGLISCFDLPVRIVEQFLKINYFEKFLKSELFYKYLAELCGKIKEQGKMQRSKSFHVTDRGKRTHKKSNSDCTNEIIKGFHSSQNTLLAMESPPVKQVKTATNSDMQIDSRQIYNSDLLWKRHSTSLTFGRVNSLGRYERDFEMDQAGPSEEKWTLKKAVRRFVHLPEDKVQEELAWQVAEMIVKDITDVTLNGDHQNSTLSKT